jgi:GxxExxY protein
MPGADAVPGAKGQKRRRRGASSAQKQKRRKTTEASAPQSPGARDLFASWSDSEHGPTAVEERAAVDAAASELVAAVAQPSPSSVSVPVPASEPRPEYADVAVDEAVAACADAAAVVAGARRVWRTLGVGYSEAIYQRALEVDLTKAGVHCALECAVPVVYADVVVGTVRADIVTRDTVVELKACGTVTEAMSFQVAKYMRHLPREWGLLVNFPQRGGERDVDILVKRRLVEPPRQM